MARSKNKLSRTKVYEQTLAGVRVVIFKLSNGKFIFSLQNTATKERVEGRPQNAPEAASFMAHTRLANLQW